ncbi:MAG: hypothetical protein ACI9F9_000340 [Candidatus Paceibacteria bacterium]|jgi:hypothetical protein
MWESYGEEVQFYVVYIREAHALDSAVPLGGNIDRTFGGGMNPLMEDPVTFAERQSAAATCATKLALEPMPMLVDDMLDTANNAFYAWPERLYLIGADGKVAYTGEPGPGGFDPDGLEKAINAELDALSE